MIDSTAENETLWPFAHGTMADFLRGLDAAATPLGSPASWPGRLRSAVETVLGCSFPAALQWGPDLILLYNDACIPLVGSRHPGAFARPALECFPEVASSWLPVVERIRNHEPILLRNRLCRDTSRHPPREIWLDLSCSPILDDAGNVGGLLTIGLDTTPRILAEQARSETELRLRRVLETEAVGVIFFDHSGTVVDANDVFQRMTGYTSADIATRRLHWRIMTPPEWVSISEEQMRQFTTTGRIGPYQKEYILKDGSRRWMLFAGRDLGDGTIAEYCIDISAHKSAEAALRASEERFRALVSASSDVIYRMSPDWTEMRQFSGRDFLADTEQSEPQWMGKYIHPDDRPAVRAAIQNAIEQKSVYQLEHRVLRDDGSFGWTFSRAVPILDPEGAIVEWFGAATDISNRKAAEEALLRSEKLATLGRLSASIAHEINNPLEAITNLLYLAQTEPGLPEPARISLQRADAELRRVAHITRQCLGFYRESTNPAPIRVTEVLDASIDLLQGKITTKQATITRSWQKDLEVSAVPGELRQVFSNLLANSLDALSPGGVITIRAARCTAVRSPRGAVLITFADNGRGIRPEVRRHIFDPLFSTKGNFGTGLGLWVSRQIIDKHGGSIRMRSNSSGPQTGTVFSVFLPC